MKATKILGIISIVSLLSLLTLGMMILSEGPAFKSVYAKASMFNLVFMIASIGMYAVHKFIESSKRTKLTVIVFGSVISAFAFLVSFNIIDFSATWNWLIAISILYLLFVQTQLLAGNGKGGSIMRLFELLVIASNLFLVIFYVIKWEFSALSLWVDIAIFVSLVSFGTGMVLSKTKKSEVQE